MRWRVLPIFSLLIPTAAFASAVDLFDLGPAMGRAGAVCATADGGAAAYYNPAGLAFRERPQLRLGGQLAHSELRLGQQRHSLARPFGITVEGATPLPLGGWLAGKIALGVAFYVVPDTILAIDSPAASEPYFPYYRNRIDRLVAVPALAFRPFRPISLGFGVNYFAAVRGYVTGSEGAYRDMQADLLEDIVGHVAPIAGLRLDLGRVSAGLTYRGEFTVPFETTSMTSVLGARLRIAIAAEALFAPETVVLGGTYRGSGWTASLDLSWRRWSRYPAPFAEVEAEVPVPLSTSGETFEVKGEPVSLGTHDVVRVAAAVEKTLPFDLQLALGYAYEPSAFGQEPGVANPVDGAKHIGSLGMGWRGPALGSVAWGVDAAVQAHWMVSTELVKDAALLPDEDPTTPGRQTSNLGFPSIDGGGLVMAATLSLYVEWITAEESR